MIRLERRGRNIRLSAFLIRALLRIARTCGVNFHVALHLARQTTIPDNDALIVMANGECHQAVRISGDAFSTGCETEEHLMECLDLFERIADRKLADGDVALGRRMWITTSDLLGCPSSRRH